MKNLNYVASLVQMDRSESSTHNRMKILQYCIDCYKEELRYKTDTSVSVAYLHPNAVLNAPFPADYEYYTKVAIYTSRGYITLSLNEDIPLIRKHNCGTEEFDTPSPSLDLCNIDPSIFTGEWLIAPHFRAGQWVGEMYAQGGGFNKAGYFRIDKQMRQFQFSNIPRTEIVLEYVSDSKTNGNTLINYMDVKPIREYVKWRLLENDRKASMGEKDRLHGLFNAAMEKRIHQEYGPTVVDFMDTSYRGIQSGVKR